MADFVQGQERSPGQDHENDAELCRRKLAHQLGGETAEDEGAETQDDPELGSVQPLGR